VKSCSYDESYGIDTKLFCYKLVAMAGTTLVEIIIGCVLVSGVVMIAGQVQTHTLKTAHHGLYMSIAVTQGHNALAITHMDLPGVVANKVWQQWQQDVASLLPQGKGHYSLTYPRHISITWQEPQGIQTVRIDDQQ